MIKHVRLAHPGALEKNTSICVTAAEGRRLTFDPAGRGIVIEKPDEHVLLPWSSVASVYITVPEPAQLSPETTVADERTQRAPARARAKARPSPGR